MEEDYPKAQLRAGSRRAPLSMFAQRLGIVIRHGLRRVSMCVHIHAASPENGCLRQAYDGGTDAGVLLMLGDRNDGGPPKGCGEHGGYPAGAITAATFDWWREEVEGNQDKLIVTCAHHMLRDTTTVTGRWEGVNGNYHRPYEDAEGASYLYRVGEDTDSTAFHDYFAANPGAIDLWLGSHTHAHPDDRFGRKEMVERRWGVIFANVGAMTRYHGRGNRRWWPSSRLLTFERGRREARLQCYLHTSHYAALGWYGPAEHLVSLRHPFGG